MSGSRRAILIGFQWFGKNYTKFAKVLALAAGALIVVSTATCLWGITARQSGMPSAWLGEVVMLLVLWIYLLPLAFAQLDGGMIRITFFIEKLPKKVGRWLGLVAPLSSVVFGLLLFRASWNFYQMVTPGSYFPLTHFPATVQRAVIPACALLLTVAGIICLVRAVSALIRGQDLLETEA